MRPDSFPGARYRMPVIKPRFWPLTVFALVSIDRRDFMRLMVRKEVGFKVAKEQKDGDE